jgi:hypothetical protein
MSALSRKTFCLAVLMSAAAAPSAQADVLTGDQLRITFAGKTIYLSAPFGALPIRYNSGGSMVAQSKAQGARAVFLGAQAG